MSRLFNQELVDAARERVTEPIGQELLHQRKVRAEGVFAWAKELQGFSLTPFMGRRKVQI